MQTEGKMKLNKIWKIVIGIATLWVALFPFIVTAGIFLVMVPSIIASERYGSDVPPPAFFSGFFIFFILIMFSSFLQMGTTAFYFVHIVKNKKGSDLLRIILGIGSIFMPYVAMPIYYFIYIWPDITPDWALEKTLQVN